MTKLGESGSGLKWGRALFALPVVLVAGLFALGVPSTSQPGPVCQRDADCGPGVPCVDGQCALPGGCGGVAPTVRQQASKLACDPSCYQICVGCTPPPPERCAGCPTGTGGVQTAPTKTPETSPYDPGGGGTGGGGTGLGVLDGGRPPVVLNTCYHTVLATECESGPNCVCGKITDSVTEQFSHHVCMEALQEALEHIPVPVPTSICGWVCHAAPAELRPACEATCEAACGELPPGVCADILEQLAEMLCCNLVAGTQVSWAECYHASKHPITRSELCCRQMNAEGSWLAGCKACCDAEQNAGSNNHTLCLQGCGATMVQSGMCF